ncbi:MAG: hypothetical protein BECKG1743D_GA0114223_102494 [Candidatus Kentron sp. G]|nr:MAG: hypothetical protein BECKG1743E_GA0114224_101724 [Candidatus Kentron sp. G]VFM99796.1 MAG: hypothetical protein BECKG1743F_GA0114225_104284 [Candidatus Kentron sp. G]VFN01081.1 MAG: hypothetical protein BECKG1743D_GA0114223_102494 [Candidatus Kentron sp. G]
MALLDIIEPIETLIGQHRPDTMFTHYATEPRPWPHPRSRRGIEHLTHWRGATLGADAAEAFLLGRQLS